jgi:hypothetical protein
MRACSLPQPARGARAEAPGSLCIHVHAPMPSTWVCRMDVGSVPRPHAPCAAAMHPSPANAGCFWAGLGWRPSPQRRGRVTLLALTPTDPCRPAGQSRRRCWAMAAAGALVQRLRQPPDLYLRLCRCQLQQRAGRSRPLGQGPQHPQHSCSRGPQRGRAAAALAAAQPRPPRPWPPWQQRWWPRRGRAAAPQATLPLLPNVVQSRRRRPAAAAAAAPWPAAPAPCARTAPHLREAQQAGLSHLQLGRRRCTQPAQRERDAPLAPRRCRQAVQAAQRTSPAAATLALAQLVRPTGSDSKPAAALRSSSCSRQVIGSGHARRA